MPFDYHLDFQNTDFRKHPELYKVGRGEQGVLLVQPYKNEILPFWKFKTPEDAMKSSQKIYTMFLDYLQRKDFVGADMSRKFLQMGYTRSRRYANHKSGHKYATKASDSNAGKVYPYSSGSTHKTNAILPVENDRFVNPKAQSAEIFRQKWRLALANPDYQALKTQFEAKYGK